MACRNGHIERRSVGAPELPPARSPQLRSTTLSSRSRSRSGSDPQLALLVSPPCSNEPSSARCRRLARICLAAGSRVAHCRAEPLEICWFLGTRTRASAITSVRSPGDLPAKHPDRIRRRHLDVGDHRGVFLELREQRRWPAWPNWRHSGRGTGGLPVGTGHCGRLDTQHRNHCRSDHLNRCQYRRRSGKDHGNRPRGHQFAHV